MKLKLFVLFSFILMVAASGFAATSKKYCIRYWYEYDNDKNSYIEYVRLSQKDLSEVGDSENCYDTWFSESDDGHFDENENPADAWTYLDQRNSENHFNYFLLESDLDFGGLNAAGTKCVQNFKPIQGFTSDEEKVFDGKGHTIKGLCYIVTADNSAEARDYLNVGFFDEIKNLNVKDVRFDKAFIRTKNYAGGLNSGVYYASQVGVLAGEAYGLNYIRNVSVSNSKVYGSRAGALVGSLESSKLVENITVSNTLVTVDEEALASEPGNVYYEIGGVIGRSYNGLLLRDVAMTKVTVKQDYLDKVNERIPDSTFVGGLVGRANFGSTSNVIANTYNVDASIQLKGDCYIEDGCMVGFLTGKMERGDFGSTFRYFANYYVGDDNVATGAAGAFYTGWGYESDNWESQLCGNPVDNIPCGDHNYRNAVTGLSGASVFNSEYYLVGIEVEVDGETETDYFSNGVIDAKYMKKDLFAAIMNQSALSHSSEIMTNQTWSRKDAVNSDYPVFSTNSMLPIYRITFLYEEGKVSPQESDMELWGGETKVSVVNDYTGKVTGYKSWMEYAEKVSKSTGYYWNASVEGLSTGYAESVSANMAVTSQRNYILAQSEKYKVHYIYRKIGEGGSNVDLDITSADGYLYSSKPVSSFDDSDPWVMVPRLWKSSVTEDEEKEWSALEPKSIYVNVCKIDDSDCRETEISGFTFGQLSTSIAGLAVEEGFEIHDTIHVRYGDESSVDKDLIYIAEGYGRSSNGPFEQFSVEATNYDFSGKTVDTEVPVTGFPSGTSTSMAPLGNLDYENDMKPIPYAPSYYVSYKAKGGSYIDSVFSVAVITKQNASGPKSRLSSHRYDVFDWLPLKDTLDKLGDASSILSEMSRILDDEFRYVRFMKFGNGDAVDFTGLHSVVKTLGEGDDIVLATIPLIKYNEYVATMRYPLENSYMNKVFIGDSLMDESWHVRTLTNSVYSFAYDIYRTDACFTRFWNPDNSGKYNESYSFDKSYSDAMNVLWNRTEWAGKVKEVGPHKYTVDFYGIWSTENSNCANYSAGVRKVILESNHGSVVLVQNWKYLGKTYRIEHEPVYDEDEGRYYFEIPSANADFTFQVEAKPEAGFALDGKIKFNGGSGYGTQEIEDGGDVQITSGMYENPTLSANFNYAMTIAAEMGDTKVFYGKDSKQKALYKLTSASEEIPSDEPQEAPVEGLDGPGEAEVTPPSVPLPKWVYTSDSCVIGWNITTKEGYEFDPVTDFNEDVAEMLIELQGKQEVYKIYPVWASAEKCVADYGYNQVSLGLDDGGKVENGTIVFDEDVLDDAGKKVSVATHEFGSANKMLLPAYMEGKELTVRSAPDEGFAVDSIVMVQADKKIVVLEEEGKLSGRLAGARFWATFFPLDTTPMEFVEDTLYVSGNAVKLTFTTTAFDARAKAEVRVNLFDALGNVIVKDSLLVKEIKQTPYKGEWEKYPLYAGSYLLRVTMTNRWRGSFVYEQDFEIADKILAVEKDSWQMVSLNQVDFSKFAWDTSDVRFYWWDESSDFGEFWQYQRLENEKGVTADNRGYWYSSVKGTNLDLKAKQPEKIDGSWALDSVYSGWNLVANPYSWYVEVCALDEAACGEDGKKPEVEFYNWNAETNTYEEAKYVKPYGAVWAKVSKPMTWDLPKVPSYVDVVSAEGDTKEASASDLKKARSMEKAASKSSWSMQANLRDASGKRHSWNLLGVSSEGWSSEVPPAGMGDQVNFAVVDGKKSFIKSFKKASADNVYEWNVELNASSDREGFLNFAGVKALNEMGLRVFVTIDGNTTEMKEGQDVGVLLKKAATSATVRVAASPAKTLVYQLNGLRALKVGAGLQVYFNASEGLAGSTAHVNLMDLNGKVLSSAVTRTALGTNSVELAAPRSGLYVVNVKAGNKQQSGQILVK